MVQIEQILRSLGWTCTLLQSAISQPWLRQLSKSKSNPGLTILTSYQLVYRSLGMEFLLIASGIPNLIIAACLIHQCSVSSSPTSLPTRSNCQSFSSAFVEIAEGERVTHLAEFRMMPVNQPEMVRRTSAELERAMSNSPGLLSATFHRSLWWYSDV